jgi:ribosomal protein S6E (S10)
MNKYLEKLAAKLPDGVKNALRKEVVFMRKTSLPLDPKSSGIMARVHKTVSDGYKRDAYRTGSEDARVRAVKGRLMSKHYDGMNKKASRRALTIIGGIGVAGAAYGVGKAIHSKTHPVVTGHQYYMKNIKGTDQDTFQNRKKYLNNIQDVRNITKTVEAN